MNIKQILMVTLSVILLAGCGDDPTEADKARAFALEQQKMALDAQIQIAKVNAVESAQGQQQYDGQPISNGVGTVAAAPVDSGYSAGAVIAAGAVGALAGHAATKYASTPNGQRNVQIVKQKAKVVYVQSKKKASSSYKSFKSSSKRR